HVSDHDQRRGGPERGGVRGPNGKRVGSATRQLGCKVGGLEGEQGAGSGEQSCIGTTCSRLPAPCSLLIPSPPPVSAPPAPNRSGPARAAPAPARCRAGRGRRP